MNWVVLTSSFFPDEKPIRMLAKSMEIHGMRDMLRTYGNGQLYENWTRMKVHMMIPVLEQFEREGITHYLYTDGRDAFFLRPWAHVMGAYAALGSPDMLVSGQPDPFPIVELEGYWKSPERYRFHCCGGYLGRVDAWLDAHRRFVRDDYESRPTGGDEAGVWQWGWVDGWFRPQVDSGCRIFQNLGGSGTDVDHITGVFNKHTISEPCLLHFTGYSKSAEYGVYDDMKPWWDAVYPEHPVEKEEVRA